MRRKVVIGVVVVGLLIGAALAVVRGTPSSDRHNVGPPGTTSAPTPLPGAVASTRASQSTGESVVVSDAAGLQRALAQARAGMTIVLSDGIYSGKDVRNPTGTEPGRFVATASGTAAAPIVLVGSRNAMLDGGGPGGGYAVHLNGANHWKLQGFTVRSAAKGIVLDQSNFNELTDLHVTDIGAEGFTSGRSRATTC